MMSENGKNLSGIMYIYSKFCMSNNDIGCSEVDMPELATFICSCDSLYIYSKSELMLTNFQYLAIGELS